MTDSGSGIEDLVDDPGVLLNEIFKQFRRESAAKAGRGNAKRFARLRDLASRVYSEECHNLLKNLPNAKERIADVQGRSGLRNPLRPEYKVFLRKFLEATNNDSWEEAEEKWLKRLGLAQLTESTLYGWWKDLNKDLSLVLNNVIYRDADGDLVYDATPPR